MSPRALLLLLLPIVFLLIVVSDRADADCQAATTCNGNGTCSPSGTCVCNVGFTGAACDQCAANYFGYPNCKFCSASTTCNGNGACDTSGNCMCNTGFTGAGCNQCAVNYFGYPNCKLCTASATCNGNGACDTSGNCVCNAGFAGAGCNQCAANFFGYPNCKFCSAASTCSGKGTCNTSGDCVCNTGYAGAACDQCAAGFTGFPDCVPVAPKAPVISTVSPGTGGTAGGTKIVITGTNFGTQGSVTIGSQPCAILQYSATQVECSLPAGQGKGLAVVLQQSGMTSNTAQFSYQPPEISAITPSSGSAKGGFALTITGANFGFKGGVTIGANQCPVTSYSQTKITCTVPAGSGSKLPVIVAVGGQTSAAALFTYTSP